MYLQTVYMTLWRDLWCHTYIYGFVTEVLDVFWAHVKRRPTDHNKDWGTKGEHFQSR